MQKLFVIAIAIVFGVNLIVSGVPIDKKSTTTPPDSTEDADNSTSNGTHKEL